MKNILFFVLLTYTSSAFCQEAIHRFNNFVKSTPFAIYDSENPSIRIAYERKFHENFGLEIGAGYIYALNDFKEKTNTASRNFGHMFNIELRNYFSVNKKSNSLAFWGIRGVIINSDNTRKMRFSPNPERSGPHESLEKMIRFQKRVIGGQVILGGKFTVTKHLFLESIIGVGTSYRQVSNNKPKSYPNPIFEKKFRSDVSNMNYNNWFTPYPYFQIHIGWAW